MTSVLRFRSIGWALRYAIAAIVCTAPIALCPAWGIAQEKKQKQFVFVVDDSGSMRWGTRGGIPTFRGGSDHDRLAIFATRVLVQLLDDSDETTVVSLNGTAEGTRPIPDIARAGDNRQSLLSALDLDPKKMAFYTGSTPCANLFGELKEVLNNANRKDAEQLVFYLTDGVCSKQWKSDGAARRGVKAWLKGIDSHKERRLRFQLIRWSGDDYTKALEDTLVPKTKGARVPPIQKGDAQSVVKTMLDALARSRGYLAAEATPSKPKLPSFYGAKKVRLLAITSGPPSSRLRLSVKESGQRLALQVKDRGDHQWMGNPQALPPADPKGKPYAFILAEYAPSKGDVQVKVTGAKDWTVIAVPDYDIRLETEIYEGSCPSDESRRLKNRIVGSINKGESVCLEVKLLNENDEVLDKQFAAKSNSDLKIVFESADGTGTSQTSNARRVDKNKTIWRFNQDQIGEGRFNFTPMLMRRVKGEKFPPLYGEGQSVQSISNDISASPGVFDLGTVEPGRPFPKDLKLDSKMPEHEVKMRFERTTRPSCLKAELAGKSGNQWHAWAWGENKKVTFKFDPFCGYQTQSKTYESLLNLEFKPRGGGKLKSKQVIVKYTLKNQFEGPRDINMEVSAGDETNRDLTFKSNSNTDIPIAIRFEHDESSSPEDIQFGFRDKERDEAFEDKEGNALQAKKFKVTPNVDGHKIPIFLNVSPCCKAGQYSGVIEYKADGTKKSRRVNVNVNVQQATFWACWGSLILDILFWLLMLLLLWYLLRIKSNSVFIRRKLVQGAASAYQYNRMGKPTDHRDMTELWERAVKHELTFGKRAAAWLKGNPLKYGLPGGRYIETMSVTLPTNNEASQRSVLKLISVGDARKAFNKPDSPRKESERIFIIAKGSLVGFPKPDKKGAKSGRLGGFVINRIKGMDTQSGRMDITSGTKLLKESKGFSKPKPGSLAGWKILI